MDENFFLDFLKELNKKYPNSAMIFKFYNNDFNNVIISITNYIKDNEKIKLNNNYNIRLSSYYEKILSDFLLNSKNKLIKNIITTIKKNNALFIEIEEFVKLMEKNKNE